MEPLQEIPYYLPSMPPVIAPRMQDKTDILHVIMPAEYHGYTHTIILLHGRDSDANGFANDFFDTMYNQLGTCVTELFPTFKWVFPSAKRLPCSRLAVFGVESMSQWFDMWKTEDPREREEEQEAEFKASVSYIQHVVQTEAGLLPNQHSIVLGGISQGCAVAIQALLQNQSEGLSGFIGLSGWMRMPHAFDSIRNEPHCHPNAHVNSTPVYTAHCKDDEVINIKYGREMQEAFKKHMTYSYNSYNEHKDGGHWINETVGVHQLVRFLDLCTFDCWREDNLMHEDVCKKCSNWWIPSEAHWREDCKIWWRLPRRSNWVQDYSDLGGVSEW